VSHDAASSTCTFAALPLAAAAVTVPRHGRTAPNGSNVGISNGGSSSDGSDGSSTGEGGGAAVVLQQLQGGDGSEGSSTGGGNTGGGGDNTGGGGAAVVLQQAQGGVLGPALAQVFHHHRVDGDGVQHGAHTALPGQNSTVVSTVVSTVKIVNTVLVHIKI
jgi:hypothetical protein